MDAPKAIFPLNEQPGNADPILEAQLTTLLSDNPDVNHSEVIPELVNSLGGFAQSTSANANFASLIFYISLVVKANDINKNFSGSLGGIGLPGANVSYGTLYYDDINNLSGSFTVNINATPLAVNINWFRNGSAFASFVGGGIGTVAGVFVGSGNWGSA